MKLQVDERFKQFLEDFRSGKYDDPLKVPLGIWSSFAWELIDAKTSEEIFLHFLRYQVERAKRTMPAIYKKPYEERKISGTGLESMSDFYQVPALVKDSTTAGIGMREKVKINPYVMLPSDVKKGYFVFKSGGTRGVPTPTFITRLDREIESSAWTRGTRYEGISEGDVALTTYNPTHKGGEEMKENIEKMGMTCVIKRTNEEAADVIKAIKDYKVNVLYTVQGPVSESDAQQKGPGVNLLKLIEAGHDILEKQIKILFLGGYRLVPEAIEWAKTTSIPLVTLLGSSEAIPQATNTAFNLDATRTCVENNLHLLNGPHLVEVVKEESGVLVPTKNGEPGILAYTTIAREGTIYLRYFPGDSAKVVKDYGECSCGLKSRIITDVGRIDIPEDVIETGCCIG